MGGLDPDLPAVPMANLAAWASAAGVFAIAYLIGSVGLVRFKFSSFADAFLLRLACGLGLTPALLLILGQRGGLLWSLPWALAAMGGAGLLISHIVRARRAGAAGDANESASSEGSAMPGVAAKPELSGRILQWAGWAAVGYSFVLLIGPAFAPPINYDVLEYHLAMAVHVFREGRVIPIPGVFYSAQPLATEMLYTLGGLLERTPWGASSGLVQWGLILLAAGLLGRVAARAGLAALIVPWVVLLFVSHPIVLKLELDRLTDITGVVFVLAGLLAWFELRPREPGDEATGQWRRVGWIWGLLAGGAVASKWTNAGTSALAIVSLAVAAVAIELRRARSGGVEESRGPLVSKAAGLFGLAALGFAATLGPWMIWLWARVGNPVAPFAAGLFPTERWSAARLDFLLSTHGPLSPFSDDYWSNLFARLTSLRLGPPLATIAIVAALSSVVLSRRIAQSDAQNPSGDSSATEARAGLFIALIIATALGCLLWGRLRVASDRFLAPIVAIQAVILVHGLAMLLERLNPKFASLAAIILAFIAVPYWQVQVMGLRDPRRPGGLDAARSIGFADHARGRLSTAGFLDRNMLSGTRELFSRVNDLPESSRVLAIGEARGYYFRRSVELSSVFDMNPVRGSIRRDALPDEIALDLIDHGFTHLLVNEYELDRLLHFHPPASLEGSAEFMEIRADSRIYDGALIAQYPGFIEFGPEPLGEAEREAYARFLAAAREQATFFKSAPSLRPAMWLAPLDAIQKSSSAPAGLE